MNGLDGLLRAACATTIAASSVITSASPLAAQGRDRSPTAAPQATASVSGLIVDAQAGSPLRRAVVTAVGPGTPSTHSVITDDEGRFTIDGLPAGRYRIVASKAAYLRSEYGATRPARPGTTVVLAAGAGPALRIVMTRGGVLAGTVRDDTGQPAANVPVYALSARDPGSIFPNADQISTQTDDRGAYRLYGLGPGAYTGCRAAPVHGPGRDRPDDRRPDGRLAGIAWRRQS